MLPRSCRSLGGTPERWGIALASTLLYPEGGGQPSDWGWLRPAAERDGQAAWVRRANPKVLGGALLHLPLPGCGAQWSGRWLRRGYTHSPCKRFPKEWRSGRNASCGGTRVPPFQSYLGALFRNQAGSAIQRVPCLWAFPY